ncbi:CHASE2 domain-containing protein [[Leptolyngbya] sp. PCC 7376]|uniref:CHASE2 domain-containing protein n=1 Tax=[Leptolyngbya] sp. PCC 7376 TaxID=111781 RepID=UPI001C1E860B|nr:CHASE2 domain-containing protein [[Leptolyngbya] sp. PCC 7376]
MLFKQVWQSIREQWLGTIFIVPGVAIAVSTLSGFGVLQGMEWLAIDQVMRLRPREPVDERITIITVDESDIRFAQQWPMSDQLMAQMIYNLAAHEPRVIGIDIYRDISVAPGREALTRAFRENPNVIGIEKVAGNPIPPTPVLDELGQISASDILLDQDGKVRRAFLMINGHQGFGARLADIYLEQEEPVPEVAVLNKEQSIYQVGRAIFRPLKKGHRGYIDARTEFGGYQMLLNYRGGMESFNSLSFQEVIENQIPAELVRDRIIIVGATAPSLNDAFVTPYSSHFLPSLMQTPGVSIHSTLASQIISATLDGRPLLRPVNTCGFYLLIAAWASIGAIATKLLATVIPSVFRSLLVTSSGTFLLLGLSFGGSLQGLVIPVFTPWLSLVVATVLTTNSESQKQLKNINCKLAIANEKLADYSRNLEQEVVDRTQELSTTLKDLQTTQTSLVQAEKMAALGQMVAGIAHEINNPINYIAGNVRHARDYVYELLGIIDLFRTTHPDQEMEVYLKELDLEYLSSDFYKLLDSIAKGAERVEDIVQSLRTFSHLDEAELKQIDLTKDLESVLLVVDRRINSRQDKIKITVEQDLQDLPLVQCYAAKINQVLLNLFDNAIDAIEEKMLLDQTLEGKILIETQALNEQEIAIRIIDNGIGISEELIPKIFDPFFTTKTVGKGTGLGLAIAHSVIVKQHHGSVSCRMTDDGKTEFSIILPIVHRLYHGRMVSV